MRRRRTTAAAAVLLSAAFAVGQTAPPTPAPTAGAPHGQASKPARPPIDFSGVWDIDLPASKGVSTSMGKAVLSVRQNGDRIWIEPVEQPRPYLSADELVVDGRLYEKAVGRGEKGTVQAAWAKDRKSLWIQTVTRNPEGEQVAYQRSQWQLRDGGKTWTRRTWTVQNDATRESFLVFRKRGAGKP